MGLYMDSGRQKNPYVEKYEVLLKKGWNILQLTAYRCADCRVIIINEDDC